MPTQHDYNRLADTLQAVGAQCASIAASLPGVVDPALLTGGSVGELVQRTVAQSMRDLSASSTRLGDIVDECRRRAEQCRRYTRLWDGYQAAMAHYERRAGHLEAGAFLGSPPSPPRSPGSWAQRG